MSTKGARIGAANRSNTRKCVRRKLAKANRRHSKGLGSTALAPLQVSAKAARIDGTSVVKGRSGQRFHKEYPRLRREAYESDPAVRMRSERSKPLKGCCAGSVKFMRKRAVELEGAHSF